MQNYYLVLGVPAGSGSAGVRRAYWVSRSTWSGAPGVSPAGVGQSPHTAVDADRRLPDDASLARYPVDVVVPSRAGGLTDDVAIDFPSVRTMVGRLCTQFWGARPSLSVELRLTAREAFDGVRVLLELPVRQTCAACGGRGELWPDPCLTCAGMGDDVATLDVCVAVPSRVHDGARVPFVVTPPLAAPTTVDLRIHIR